MNCDFIVTYNKRDFRGSVSINRLVTLALAEKLSALVTEDYLTRRASRGSRSEFEQAMAQVADVEPLPHDTL